MQDVGFEILPAKEDKKPRPTAPQQIAADWRSANALPLLTLAQLEARLARLDAASSRAAPLVPVAAAVARSADPVAQLLTQALGELLPGAAVLSWDRRRPGLVAGQMAADGLVFQFRCDANQIAYRPAWDGLSQGRWEARSAGFLAARSPGRRLDAPGAGGKKRCSRGYGCGNSCISLKNECRLKVSSAASKTRLQRLQALANAGDVAAGTLAGQEQAKRNSQAAAIKGARQQERAARAPKTPPSLAGQVRVVAPASIEVDPERFQFKLGHGAQGEVGSLRGVRKWDENLAGVVSVWQDPADGKTYVVNGHNRLGLAKRHGAEGLTVRYLKAASAAEARAIGALQNIAEGAGTPVDAAKFFRDSNIRSQADVEKLGLPLSSGRAAQGLGLARLPAEMFRSVVDGDLSASRGAIIGNSGLDGLKMSEIGKLLRQRKNISDGTLAEFVEALAVSERQSQQTFDLFGASEKLVDNGLARAELTNAIARKISKEKRLFKMVSNSQAAATLAEKAGNVINKGESAEVASAADQLGRTFKALKNVSGPMATAINAAAQQVSEGANKTTVQRKLYAEVVAAMELEFKGKRRDGWAQSTGDRFAELEARIDAARKRCQTGYGCGSTCISLQKECRSKPGSSISKERLKRIQRLARGEVAPRGLGVPGQTAAAAMAASVQGQRSQRAVELQAKRQARARQPAPVAAITAAEIKRAFPLPTAQQRQQRDQLQNATNLAAAERQAVFDYSATTRGPRAASALNRCLRQPASCRQKKATAAMASDFDAALQKLPKNIEGAPFYRGIAVKDSNMQRLYQQLLKARPGERFADQGYGSYSDDRRVAAIYAEANGPAPAIVLVSRSQAITGISAISGYRKERESILPRGTAQTVRRVRRQGATIYVELD